MDAKRFDDYTNVECNDCEYYWNDSCDGVLKDSEKICTAFKATKKKDIPEQINNLKLEIKELKYSMLIVVVIFIFHLLGHIIWST